MSRYIDADKLAKDVLASWDKDNHKTLEASRVHRQEHHHLMHIIEKQPTADVVEVRHGEWETVDSDLGYVEMKCSLCGHKHLFYTNQGYPYCPNCGAKMDGERREKNER